MTGPEGVATGVNWFGGSWERCFLPCLLRSSSVLFLVFSFFFFRRGGAFFAAMEQELEQTHQEKAKKKRKKGDWLEQGKESQKRGKQRMCCAVTRNQTANGTGTFFHMVSFLRSLALSFRVLFPFGLASVFFSVLSRLSVRCRSMGWRVVGVQGRPKYLGPVVSGGEGN